MRFIPLEFLQTSANKLGTLLNALIRGNTPEHFDQMIHIADTIATCAEVQDNIAFLHEQKVFEKLLKALAAMQQDVAMEVCIRVSVLRHVQHSVML